MIQSPRAEDVQQIFSTIATGYDSANDAITFGMARLWRRQLVKWSGVRIGDRVLDCATGTGDLALEFKKAVGPEGTVIGTDFCKEMLDFAPGKARQLGLQVDFQQADAMDLPFSDNEFDVVSIAYGIRNVSDAEKALREMARVLKPGGKLMVLETGDAQWPLVRWGFDFYCKHVMPRLGGWITGKRSAYEYLSQSSSRFPARENFTDIMMATGQFSSAEHRTLMAGASFLYKAVKK